MTYSRDEKAADLRLVTTLFRGEAAGGKGRFHAILCFSSPIPGSSFWCGDLSEGSYLLQEPTPFGSANISQRGSSESLSD
jgi:hypothetical protein